ncbi:MAG: molybdopterin-dependent oxidoreductase, partial [Abditibacteriales bacterium]|nr:molybdopterin-dependent oxidoreductase [Abditibacteriales bacterium]MDW8364255.1 molybdopterin cofactor-binding domain-containing protein [Abditibacteriales bacterium]
SWGVIAAQLAREAGAPVKLFLNRAPEHHIGGVSPGGTQKFRAGASKDGKLTVLERVVYGDGFNPGPGPEYVYVAPAVSRNEFLPLNLNAGKGRAFRAPHHPHVCFATEQVMDELAHALGMDPIEFRIRNLNPDSSDPTRATVDRTRIAQLRHGAELIGWNRRNNPPGAGKGPIKRGIGVACHTWGGGPHGNNTEIRIFSDGRVEVRTATQDLGTGTRTNIALVAAEELGLMPDQITVFIGNTDYPPDGGSGGSTTVGAVASGAKIAAEKAKQALFAKVAADLGASAADLDIGEGGRVFVKGNPSRSLTWKQACAKIGPEPLVVRRTQGENQPGLTSSGVAGVQFAEVEVDTETGKVRVVKFVAIQDQGFVVNRLTCEGQIYGGAIMGISWALGEQRILDPKSGIMLNPDILNYRIAGPKEIPEIITVVWDPPEVRARGVIGNGEPPVIAPAGAIANAIYNAIGVRVRELPFTPDRILNALARKEA